MLRRKGKSKVKTTSILAEPVDQVVTPWLLITLLVMTGLFVVLQSVT